MMLFRRSDSRVTICKQAAMLLVQIGNLGEHADRAGNRGQWIADFVGDGSRQAAHSCKPVLHAHFPLQAPNLGQVVEGIDVAQFAGALAQRGSHPHPESLAEAIGRIEAHFTVSAAAILQRWAKDRERVAPEVRLGSSARATLQ